MSGINDFLSKYRVEKNDAKSNIKGTEGITTGISHVSMISPRGSFNVKKDETKFLSLYCRRIKIDIVGIAEMPRECSPLHIDFDFRFSLDEGLNRKYNNEDIKLIVHEYQNIIAELIDPQIFEEKKMYCVVLEKKKPRTDNGTIKDGFHLHFPYFIVNSYIQDVIIRDKIIKIIKEDKKYEKIRNNIVKKITDEKGKDKNLDEQLNMMVDKIAKKPWLMYGSKKTSTSDMWDITSCYDEKTTQITIKELFADDFNKLLKKKKKHKYFIPYLLSIRRKVSPTNLQHIKIPTQNINKKKFVKYERDIERSYQDLQYIKNSGFMEMLSGSRAENYNDWIYIGWTLFNIGQGDDIALEMWKDFSQRSTKYKDGECEKIWSTMDLRGITIKTLKWMARQDNPDKYKEWEKTDIDNLLEKSVIIGSPTHNSIADIIYAKFSEKYICADNTHDIWYEFFNHRWHRVDGGISIFKLMPGDIANLYTEYIRKLTLQIQEDEDGKYKKYRTVAFKILSELNKTPFCLNVLKMCKIKFYDPNFLKNIDENRDLLCFENGVYDLKRGCLRDGSPDDYITLSTGRKYEVFSYEDYDITQLEEYLRKVFVNPRIREYFEYFVCSCFQGGNRNKILAFFTGNSHGGKSMIVRLLEIIFGDYAISFPRETFIEGRGGVAGNARPDLARIRGKRVGFGKELAKNETLNIGMCKLMTGNDSMFVRNLYEKGSDVKPMFTLIIMCNDPPKIPEHDEAMWERVKCIEFQSKFPSKNDKKFRVPKDEDEQYKKKIFPRDLHLEEKLADFSEPLTWLLLEKFKHYYKNGYKEPKEVRLFTQTYKLNNDVFSQFIKQKLDKTKNKKDKITFPVLFAAFKGWYISNYPSYKEKIGENMFKNEMNKRLNQYLENNRWLGYRIKVENYEEDRLEKSEEDKSNLSDKSDDNKIFNL